MSEEIKNALREVLHEALKPIVERLDRIENKLDSTYEQVVRNSETITEILGGQERQDRILELLSVRSIGQEADIKKFKRMK